MRRQVFVFKVFGRRCDGSATFDAKVQVTAGTVSEAEREVVEGLRLEHGLVAEKLELLGIGSRKASNGGRRAGK